MSFFDKIKRIFEEKMQDIEKQEAKVARKTVSIEDFCIEFEKILEGYSEKDAALIKNI